MFYSKLFLYFPASAVSSVCILHSFNSTVYSPYIDVLCYLTHVFSVLLLYYNHL